MDRRNPLKDRIRCQTTGVPHLSLCYHFYPIFLNFPEQEGIEVLVLSDNINRTAQKGFKV